MNRKQTIEYITSDVALMKRWKDLITSGDLDKILSLCECHRGNYSKGTKADPNPHINSENRGGMMAWEKLNYLLTSLPFQDHTTRNDSDDYVGFVRDSRSKLSQRVEE